MTNQLQNHVAVVTGAGSGIGKATASVLAAAGASLVLVGRQRDTLYALARALPPSVPPAQVATCDLSDDRSIADFLDGFRHHHDRLDILVHSAGAITLGRLESTSIEDFDRQFDINLRAPFLLTQGLLPAIKAARGQIVFINSSVVTQVREEVGAYAASKHALKALVDVLRMEVNPDGVRVLSVFPGNTATPMQEAIQKYTGRHIPSEYLLRPEDVAQAIIAALTLPRTAELTDLHLRPSRKPPV